MNAASAHPSDSGAPTVEALPKEKKHRLIGVDAARGIALVGMIAVHVFSLYDDQTDSVSWMAAVFSGRSAALFAVMAGVGLALLSGGSTPRTGTRAWEVRRSIAIRAGVIAVIGLTLGLVEVDIAIILVCYALLFILALPFTTMGVRALALLTALWALFSPAIAYLVRPALYESPFMAVLDTDPNWTSLADPFAFFSSLFFTGSYPVFQWFTYLLFGLLLGRLALDSRRIQLVLATGGAIMVLGAQLASTILLNVLGGAEALRATGEVDDWYLENRSNRLLLDLSETDQTTSLWWLAIDAPHTGTSVDLLNTMGSAALMLGLCLLVSRYAGRMLLPLTGPGAMTLTLYTAHVLVMSVVYAGEFEIGEAALFWWQVLVLAAVGMGYGLSRRRGPLEHLIARAAGRTGANSTIEGREMPRRTAPRDR